MPPQFWQFTACRSGESETSCHTFPVPSQIGQEISIVTNLSISQSATNNVIKSKGNQVSFRNSRIFSGILSAAAQVLLTI